MGKRQSAGFGTVRQRHIAALQAADNHEIGSAAGIRAVIDSSPVDDVRHHGHQQQHCRHDDHRHHHQHPARCAWPHVPLRYFRARMLSGRHSCFQCSAMYVTEPPHAEWAYAAVLNTVRLLRESVWERICLRRLSPLVLRGARGWLKRSKVQTIVYTSGP